MWQEAEQSPQRGVVHEADFDYVRRDTADFLAEAVADGDDRHGSLQAPAEDMVNERPRRVM
jgi:hypothetical protein